MSRGYEGTEWGNIANSYVICMVTDHNQTYHGFHFEKFINI